MRAALFALVVAAGCVRAPRPIDVDALVKAKGTVVARQDLEIRTLDDPRDIQAHLALARLADQAGRPGQALAELETVIRIGGPLGTRWHGDDKARFARLLAQRGRVRLARQDPGALSDLTRARDHGAAITDDEILSARAEVALARLRHIDAKERAAGQAELARLADAPSADPSWLGAKEHPIPQDRGQFGVWLWQRGAKRAAFEALRDWELTTAAKGGPLHDAYLKALRWWTPIDLPPPAGTDLSGPERCAFVEAACTPADAIADPRATGPLFDAPLRPPYTDPAGWLVLTLQGSLRQDYPWGRQVAQRIDLATTRPSEAWARTAAARLMGTRGVDIPDADLDALTPNQRLVVAAGRVLDGASETRIRAALGSVAATPQGAQVLAILHPAPPTAYRDPLATALEACVASRSHEPLPVAAILDAYRASPARADRVATDAVARASDSAAAYAALGTLYEALEDPARARAAWQAAVDANPRPVYVQGLAIAAALGNDPDAAMIHATTAAAALGDPAYVWWIVARRLERVGQHVHALEAAHNAMELASVNTYSLALDVALAASRALGRDGQVADLIDRRRLAPRPVDVDRGVDDPTDAVAALAAYRRTPGTVNVARMWIASRWNPPDAEIRAALLDAIAPDDPRRATIVSELVALAVDGRCEVPPLLRGR